MLDGHNSFVCLERVHFPEFIDRKPDTFSSFSLLLAGAVFIPSSVCVCTVTQLMCWEVVVAMAG
jgi:hypothetical protein